MRFSLNKTTIGEDNKFSFNIKITEPGELVGEFVVGSSVVNLTKIQVTSLNPNSTPSPALTPVFTPTPAPTPVPKVIQKLTGTPFGTSPAWNDMSTFEKAFDGDVNTFFDYQIPDGGYTGIDLGENKASKVTLIRYHPRFNGSSRMIDGKFQGSNTLSNTGYVDLHTINNMSVENVFTETVIQDTNYYRYLRYLSPNGGYCNVSEIEFYGEVG